jgi:siderophore synthetase component
MNASQQLDYDAFIRQELGADIDRFSATLQAQGKSLADMYLVAVHPWQWQRIVSARFHRELAQQEIIWLGQGGDSYRPQQSIRSLANQTSPAKCYLKLSLSITNTSTSRILAGHTVLNGPIVTDWLKALVAGNDYARQLDFIILGEILGVTFNYQQLPDTRRAPAYGVMGAIWRESLRPSLRDKEDAVPCNGLCHLDQDGTPLIDPWIARHGLRDWTRQFLKVTVEPIIHMLFAEGVAMESHAQNIVLLHQNGWPTRIALKDFHDGVRFSPAHLAKPELSPALVPVPESHARINRNSFILTDDLEAVRDFTCDAFFFICLAEQAIFMQRHYQLEEEVFWAMTADIIIAYQQTHPEHGSRYAAFDVFGPSFKVEELTKRRLLGDSEPRFRAVPNPLHNFRPASC